MAIALVNAFGALPATLRNELLDEYNEISSHFLEGKWKPSELSGGRFCEVVYSVVKGELDGSLPANASKPSDFPGACKKLESHSNRTHAATHSLRILIPRVLPGVYDIRNNRNVGHVGGEVDANHMDASYVLATAKWVMAELVRIFHGLTVSQAQDVVEALTDKVVPAIWKMPTGDVRVLNRSLSMRERTLLLLYDNHPTPLESARLRKYVEYGHLSNYRSKVIGPLHAAALVTFDSSSDLVYLSPTGVVEVETNIPLGL